MSRNRHGPSGSCGCCGEPCYSTCPDGTVEVISEVEWSITFPNELTVWEYTPGFFNYWTKWVYSGLSVLNGTYVVSKNTTTCAWSNHSSSETVTLTAYVYDNEVLVDSGGEEYNCPNLSGYTSVTVYTDITVDIFANWATWQASFRSLQGLFVAFDGYGQGSTNNSPCESATINWNTLDNYPVDTRCSGISNQVVTAVLTPTII